VLSETHQPIAVAEPALIEKLNQLIAAGQLKNRAGQPIKEKSRRTCARRQIRLPDRENIPIMLIDEAIPL
jgi:hypothetical protein